MTVEVTQADREAAADFICWQRAATQSAIEGQHDVRQFFVAGFSKAIRQGIWDEHQVVQAFAAHRTTALEGVAGLVEALTSLQRAEATYRRTHDLHGDADMRTGRAWDAMRRASDRAKADLATFRDQGGR